HNYYCQHSHPPYHDLPSFPTRRSSDLHTIAPRDSQPVGLPVISPPHCRQLRVPPGDWLDPVYFGGPPVAWPRVRDGLCAPAYSQFSRPVRTRIILGWKVWNLCLPTTGGPGAANPGYTEDDPTKPIWPKQPAPV